MARSPDSTRRNLFTVAEAPNHRSDVSNALLDLPLDPKNRPANLASASEEGVATMFRILAPTEVGVGTRNKAPFELPLPTFANGCPSPTEVDYEHSTAQPAAWSVFDCRSRRLRLVSLAKAKSIQQWFQARRSATNRLAQHLYLSSSHRLPLRRAPRGTTRSKNQRRLP